MVKLETSKGKYYFNCKLARSPYKKCTPHIIHYENLVNIVTTKIADKINTYCEFDDITEKLNNFKGSNKVDLLLKDSTTLQKEIEALANSITNLYLDKTNNIISEQEFIEISSNIRLRKTEKQTEYEKISKELEAIKNKQKCHNENVKLIEKYRNFNELNFRIVNDFVDCIKIGIRDKKTKEQTVEIHWNF